jgi:predicted RNA binding protein YcfA (HicA-like mRNA interferase family)
MKIREVIKLIEKDGWYLVRVKGDHRQYKHPSKKGLVTISGHFNEDVAKGTLNSILKEGRWLNIRLLLREQKVITLLTAPTYQVVLLRVPP